MLPPTPPLQRKGATLPARSCPSWPKGCYTATCAAGLGSRCSWGCGQEHSWTPREYFLPVNVAAFHAGNRIVEQPRWSAPAAGDGALPPDHRSRRLRPTRAPAFPARPRGFPPGSGGPRGAGQGRGRYLRGRGAVLLPGAAGLVVVAPAAAGRQPPVRVVVVEGVPQPAAVPPLPPVVLARPRRLRGQRGRVSRARPGPPRPGPARRPPPRSPATTRRPPCCPA